MVYHNILTVLLEYIDCLIKIVTDFAKTLHLHTSNFTTLGTHNLTSKEDIIFKFSQVIEQC